MIVTLLMLLFEVRGLSFCLSLDICPFDWRLGLSLQIPPDDAKLAVYSLGISVPTLRLELGWFDIDSHFKPVPVQEEKASEAPTG